MARGDHFLPALRYRLPVVPVSPAPVVRVALWRVRLECAWVNACLAVGFERDSLDRHHSAALFSARSIEVAP